MRPRAFKGYMGWVDAFGERVAAVEEGERGTLLPHVDGVRATGEDVLTDEVMLQLRKGGGLRLRERIVDRFTRGEVIGDVILRAVEESVQRGLVDVEVVEEDTASTKPKEVVVRLTDPDGFLMSNDVISDIFVALDEFKLDC